MLVYSVLNALQNERNTECFTLQHTTNYRPLKAVTSFTFRGSKNRKFVLVTLIAFFYYDTGLVFSEFPPSGLNRPCHGFRRHLDE